MEAKKVLLVLKSKNSQTAEGQLRCVAELDNQHVEITPAPDASVVVQEDVNMKLSVYAANEVLSCASIPVKQLLKAGSQSVTLPNGIHLHIERPTAQPPRPNPVPKGDYLAMLDKAQRLSQAVQNSVSYLEAAAQSELDDSGYDTPVKRRPTQGSPSKKSRSKPRARQEVILEVPATTDITLDNLSAKKPSDLVQVLVGLEAKRQLHSALGIQTAAIQSLSQETSDKIEVVYKSLEEILTKYSAQTTQSNELVAALMKEKAVSDPTADIETLSELRQRIDPTIQKQAHEERDCLRQNLTETHERLQEALQEQDFLEAELEAEVASFQQSVQALNAESATLLADKQDLQRQLATELSQADQLKQSIRASKNAISQLRVPKIAAPSHPDISDNYAKLEAELESLKKLTTERYDESQRVINSINTSLQLLDDNTTTLSNVLSSVLNNQEPLLQTPDELDKSIDKSTISQRSLSSKSLSRTEEKWTRLTTLSSAFEDELEYLSNLTCKWLHQSTPVRRTYAQLQHLVEDRDHELAALLHSTALLKKERPVYSGNKTDPLDMALAQCLNDSDLPLLVPFSRQAPGVYLFGNKLTVLTCERGKLQAKVGGGFLPLEQFIESYQPIELERQQATSYDYSQAERKFLGKWAEGVIPPQEHLQTRMRKSLLGAWENHARPLCLTVQMKRSRTVPVLPREGASS